MTPSELNFILGALKIRNRRYKYYKDKYALELLKHHLNDQITISELKKSNLGFLTKKKLVTDILAKAGNNLVSNKNFQPDEKHGIDFEITLGRWGDYDEKENDPWYQTSRTGLNLVLQLNFDKKHNDAYHTLIKPVKTNHPFVYYGHPVCYKQFLSMSWARLDVDLDAGEVLIEEIQNDWLRNATAAAKWGYKRLKKEKVKDKDKPDVYNTTSLDAYIKYYEMYLKKYIEVWEEATMNLVIDFSLKELGCKRIFYNTFDTWNYMKGLADDYTRPPKSLYTKLPKRFGFKRTDEVPILLRKDVSLKKKLRKEGLEWHVLAF